MLVMLNGVVALCRKDEVGGNQLRPLMQKLVERMLRIRRRLAKDDCASGVFDIITRSGDCLSIRLHG